MTLSPRFRLDHRDDLGMGLRQFCLGQQMPAYRKLLKDRFDQHHVISSRSGAPTMADTTYLTVLDGVSLPKTLAMAHSTYMHNRLILDTLMGRDHPAAHGIDTFTKSKM